MKKQRRRLDRYNVLHDGLSSLHLRTWKVGYCCDFSKRMTMFGIFGVISCNGELVKLKMKKGLSSDDRRAQSTCTTRIKRCIHYFIS